MLLHYVRLAGWPVIPVLLVLFLIVSLVLGYLVGLLRREFVPGEYPWRHTLLPLGVLASRLGLLATTFGLFQAFHAVASGSPPQQMAIGLTQGLLCNFAGVLAGVITSSAVYLFDRSEDRNVKA